MRFEAYKIVLTREQFRVSALKIGSCFRGKGKKF